MENKRIAVVTGANGFVGSHLVDLLIEKGFIVKCITRKSSNLKWLQGKNVEIFDCGLFDKEGLKKAFKGADYIFHVAGVVKSKKPEGYYKANVEATKNVLESAVEVKETIKKIVIVGSQTAAGPSLDGKPVIESLPVKPITTYGRSKAEQEKLAATFMDKLPISICRAPAIYGERDTEIFIFFKTFASGLMTTIGFDKKVISLIHVKDLVYGLYLSAIKNISAGQTYFVSSEKIYTWEEIGEVTSKVLNKKAFKVKVPHSVVYSIAAVAQFFAMFSSKAATLNIEKARDLTRKAWICSTEKAVKQLNYRQKISIEDGIKRTVDWYKKEGWLK
ncbi:MAG TPA: NAD-dependent epimerase/dehydratase family protein [Ignavibacteriaceae bacterium]|nr:NAD-dependent epimerase/dehydratase family protein [Ignavibacteriaceae bacterium]